MWIESVQFSSWYLTVKIRKFADLIIKKNAFRIPLRFLTDISIVNHPIELDTKIVCTLETDLNKLFKSNKQVAAITAPDAQLIWPDAPSIKYKLFRLNDSTKKQTYCRKKYFAREIKKRFFKILTNYRQACKAILSSLHLQIDNYDKSDKHSTIYNSYNAEVVSTLIQNISIENVGNTYSVTNKLKYGSNDGTEKTILYKQFVAWNCNRGSIPPLKDHTNNPIYQ